MVSGKEVYLVRAVFRSGSSSGRKAEMLQIAGLPEEAKKNPGARLEEAQSGVLPGFLRLVCETLAHDSSGLSKGLAAQKAV